MNNAVLVIHFFISDAAFQRGGGKSFEISERQK